MDLVFDDDGQWSFDYDSFMLWATLGQTERIQCQLTRAMFGDCLGINDRTKAEEHARRYRITYLVALKNLAKADGFSAGDERWKGKQLILTSGNFLPTIGAKNPFVDGPNDRAAGVGATPPA
jgi:hypothetical protein